MEEIRGKHAELSIDHPDMLAQIAKALSAPLRLDILTALGTRAMSVGELARELDVPMSSVALAVRNLEEASLIRTETQPGSHGSLKICCRALDSVAISLIPRQAQSGSVPLEVNIPIGSYSIAEGIKPTCGLLSPTQALGPMDYPRVFYVPDRMEAQLLWFREGYLEYRVSLMNSLDSAHVDWIELSFEACSEAPLYRDPWPSDIYVAINHRRVGVWTSPSDCGGRRGLLTPEWWGLTNTQYGFLKTWRVDHSGSWLDNARLSDVALEDLALDDKPYISIEIGVDPDSENRNGLNLFGEKFGDHPQNILFRVGHTL